MNNYIPTDPLEPGNAVDSSAVINASGIAHTSNSEKPTIFVKQLIIIIHYFVWNWKFEIIAVVVITVVVIFT